MSILAAIDREYQNMKDRDWDRIFLFFDLHGTVIKPNFEVGNTDIEYYPYAKETLLFLTDKADVDLNIYTCSHEHEILEYQRKFRDDGIFFKYVNENPDVQTNGYGNYDKKPYMNLLFEDKAGFDGEVDWLPVLNKFKKMYEHTEYEYEMFFNSEPDEMIQIYGWHPISIDMIKQIDRIPKYIASGLLRKINK